MGRIIVEYVVVGASYAHVGSGTASPKDWEMQGSNDLLAWDVLDTVTGEVAWGDCEQRTFTMDVTAEYQYYQLHCTDNNGNANYVCLSEIQLHETPAGPNVCTLLTANNAPPPYTADQSSALAGAEAFKGWNAYDGAFIPAPPPPGQW